jgi:hypothetical protein
MDAIAMIEARRSRLYAEIRDAEGKYRVAVKDAREKRKRLLDLKARSDELLMLSIHVEREMKSAADDGSQVDAETGARVSKLILTALLNCGHRAMTLGDLAEVMSHADVKRSTISATLYNMKKRGEIEHDEQAGLYRLAGVSAAPRSVLRPTTPK